MPEVHRLFDKNTAGAPIIATLQKTVFANFLPVSVTGSPVKPHGPGKHHKPFTGIGCPNVFANYLPVNVRGNIDTCGHIRAFGSPNVFIYGIL